MITVRDEGAGPRLPLAERGLAVEARRLHTDLRKTMEAREREAREKEAREREAREREAREREARGVSDLRKAWQSTHVMCRRAARTSAGRCRVSLRTSQGWKPGSRLDASVRQTPRLGQTGLNGLAETCTQNGLAETCTQNGPPQKGTHAARLNGQGLNPKRASRRAVHGPTPESLTTAFGWHGRPCATCKHAQHLPCVGQSGNRACHARRFSAGSRHAFAAGNGSLVCPLWLAVAPRLCTTGLHLAGGGGVQDQQVRGEVAQLVHPHCPRRAEGQPPDIRGRPEGGLPKYGGRCGGRSARLWRHV
jgi:hypothetical protein